MTAALERAVARALDAARGTGRATCAVWRRREADADGLAELARADEDVFYYAVPEADFAIAAHGVAHAVEAEGHDRFARIEREQAEVSPFFAGDDDAPAALPLWVGGFGFADAPPRDDAWRGFAPARWWIPSELVFANADGTWRSSARRVAPGDDAERVVRSFTERRLAADANRNACEAAAHDRFTLDATGDRREHTALVAEALAAIARGDLEKVVVARALDLERGASFDAIALLRELRTLHPRCACYAVSRDGAWFVGATPERLLQRHGETLRAIALAGSAPRGRTPEEDARLRRALVESKKEQSEHAVALRGLREALTAECRDLDGPEAPTVLELGSVQHLATPLVATLGDTSPGLLALAGRVHPTAAVGGAPRQASMDWLTEREGLDRGWYAGLVGWLTAAGDGELSAALRCALLRENRARLFAGGGIVAGADPQAELRETRLKWNALLPSLLEL